MLWLINIINNWSKLMNDIFWWLHTLRQMFTSTLYFAPMFSCIRIQCITCGTLLIIKSINSIINVEAFQNDNILVQGTHKTLLITDQNWWTIFSGDCIHFDKCSPPLYILLQCFHGLCNNPDFKCIFRSEDFDIKCDKKGAIPKFKTVTSVQE
jgi:hypothetical protein